MALVSSGDAGIYADALSEKELEKALRQVFDSETLRRQKSEACLALARSRTWEDAARKTLAVCAEAAGA